MKSEFPKFADFSQKVVDRPPKIEHKQATIHINLTDFWLFLSRFLLDVAQTLKFDPQNSRRSYELRQRRTTPPCQGIILLFFIFILSLKIYLRKKVQFLIKKSAIFNQNKEKI